MLLDAAGFDPAFTFGFRHTEGLAEIAGFSIHNNDNAGIGFDDLCYSVGAISVEGSTWGSIKAQYRCAAALDQLVGHG